jgi:hypothetical protein
MLTQLCLRWTEKRGSYRPAGEVIQTREYDVAPVDELSAKGFVLRNHYSGTYPAARFRFGLFRRKELVGVAVFSHPVNDAVLTNEFPGEAVESVELGRFVLLDQVPGNGETWFLGRAFEQLRRHGLIGVLSYSDPLPRERADGVTVFGGHVGTIYQAFNGIYRGRARGGMLHLLPDGAVFSRRSLQKIRQLERGWRYSVEQLVRAGARSPRSGEDLRAWLEDQLPHVTRRRPHPGNHKYVWALRRSVRKHLAKSLPYPKIGAV